MPLWAPDKAVTNRFPQVGGNQISEAPGVVSDPTLGDEGMEPPPPHTHTHTPMTP